MPEPVTTIGLGALAAYLGKDGLEKLLGPTAEYLGSGLKDFTQRRFETVGRIFSAASGRLGSKIDEAGSVPPKLLKQVVDDGSFADDNVEIEYLGGVLASSRTTQSRDNRGVAIAKLIDSLSNYQLRAHFLIYRTIKDIYRAHKISPMGEGRNRLGIYIPASSFISSMQFSEAEISKLEILTSHIFFGLHKNGLIEDHFQFGPQETMKSFFPEATESGIMCKPSAAGIELFLWAFGAGDLQLFELFSSSFDPTIEGVPLGIPSAHGLTPFDPSTSSEF
jgi:hypothetical protein